MTNQKQVPTEAQIKEMEVRNAIQVNFQKSAGVLQLLLQETTEEHKQALKTVLLDTISKLENNIKEL